MNNPPGKPRHLSEKEWEGMKDVLHRHYIQENKTLNKIQKIMRDEHNISLSPKQLTKRFAKWKFKKNVKKAETEAFLQKTEFTPGQVHCSVEGVRITAAKRERWERTARSQLHEGLQHSSHGGPRGSVDPVSAYQYARESADDVANDTLDVSSSPVVSNLLSNTISPMVHHDPSDIRLSPSTLSPNTISPMAPPSTMSPRSISPLAFDEPAIGQDDASHRLIPDSSLPISPTSGDSEFLLLCRLYSALNIDTLNDITPFYQPAIAIGTVFWESNTISNEEYIHLSSGGGRASSQSAFSGELYAFPSLDHNCSEPGSVSKYHDVLRSEMQECKEIISKFEIMSFPGNNVAFTTSIERLAVAYFGLGHYDKAERQFNRVLPALVQRHGSNSYYVVSVKRDLAEVILHLGRSAEANQLAQEVHKSALALDTSGGHLTENSLQILAQSYGSLGNLKKEEELLRELVQIRLEKLGPRHGDTLAAIRSLCDSLIDSERHAESEELLRVALELSQGAQRLSDRRKCLIFRKLATVLYKQKNYPESKMLYRKTEEMSERLLGNEHQDTLRCRFWLCKVLRAQGSLEESSKILHQTVETQIKTRGELRGSTIESMAGLSTLLVQMEHMEEAKMWMMRALRCSQEIGDVGSTRTMRFRNDLGRLHTGQGQRKAFVDLYEEMGREISTLVGPGSRSIEEMSKRCDRNQR